MIMLKMLRLSLLGIVLLPLTTEAETVNVPIFASFALMQQLMQQELFKSPEHTAVYAADKLGCTTVSFANPRLSGVEGLLQVRADVDVKLGLPTTGKKCTVLNQWSGSAALKGEPVIVGPDSLAVQFKVVDTQVFDAAGMQLNGGFVKQALQSRLHPLLDQFKLDLQPALVRAKNVLPSVLHGYSTEQLAHLLDSLHLGDVKADANGLNINVLMDALNPNVIQSLAGTVNKSALPAAQKDWDMFLSSIIKQMSKNTDSQEMREALLEVLQDARQQLQTAAQKTGTAEVDPFKQIFINSWERLAPLARTLSAKKPHQELLQLLSFVSAPDLFKTLDALGKGLGIDVSVEGLQKLVPLLTSQQLKK